MTTKKHKVSAKELIATASGMLSPRALTPECTTGSVAAALLAKNGKVYTGINLNAACGIGTCSEYVAVLNMLADGENIIHMIVAINKFNHILPPCGRCRELLYQVARENADTDVIINTKKIIKLKKLLPEDWQENWGWEEAAEHKKLAK